MQFNGFQAARAGLKKHAPQLASSGTGGSYFIADEQARHPLQVLNNALQYPSALFQVLLQADIVAYFEEMRILQRSEI